MAESIVPKLRTFFKEVYSDAQGWFCIPCYNHVLGRWEQTGNNFFYFPDDLDKTCHFIETENREGKCVYFTPSLFVSKSAEKEKALPATKRLFADIDEYEDPKKIQPEPTIIWETSQGRFQAIWLLKEPLSWKDAEPINCRLTYSIGADKGGWHLNKILRVPYSVNYKYNPPEGGKIIWTGGSVYSPQWVKEFVKSPFDANEDSQGGGKIPDDLPSYEAILEKHREHIPKVAWDILNTVPDEKNDWSAKLWNLENLLLDAGFSLEETFVIVRDSNWNKYRRDGRPDEQLWAEVNKAYQNKNSLQNGPGALPTKVTLRLLPDDPMPSFTIDWRELFPNAPSLIPPGGLIMRRLSDIKEEQVSYLWYPYIPLGKLTIFEGDPGDGKTYAALEISAKVSSGDQLPQPKPDKPGLGISMRGLGRVVYMSNEDNFADTLKPRLMGMGANEDNIFSLEGRRDKKGKPLPVTLEDVQLLDNMLTSYQPSLVVVDPIQSYFGSERDSHKATQVRPVMDGLAKLAEKHDCAILVLRHLTKRNSDKAIYRGMDSIDFMAAVRSAVQIVADPENSDDEETGGKNRVMVHIKASTTRQGTSLRYKIEPDPEEPLRGRFSWMGTSDLKAADLGQEEDPDKGKSAIEDAIEFLLDTVSQDKEDSEAEEIKGKAKKRGIAPTTLRRAREKLQKQYEMSPSKGGLIITPACKGRTSKWKIFEPEE